MEGVITAVLAAGLAFAAAQYHNVRIKRRETMVNHLNALVNLERRLNEYMRIASDNERNAKTMMNTIGAAEDGSTRIFWGSFESFEVSLESLSRILSLDVINDCFSLNQKLRKLNHDMETIMSSYGLTRQSFVQGSISSKQYTITCTELLDGLRLIQAALKFTGDKVIDLLVSVRSQLKLDTPSSEWKLYRKPASRTVGMKIKAETRDIVMREIESVRKQSLADRSSYLDPKE